MAKKFDPYAKWFNIPPDEQPPDHYRLLGIARFEIDVSVIDEAAEARAAFLHDVATGPQIAVTQRLLNEVAAARLCLTDAAKKSAYDAELRQPGKAQGKAIPSATVVKPPGRSKPVPMARPLPPPQVDQRHEFSVVTEAQTGATTASRLTAPAAVKKSHRPVWLAAGAAAAVVLVLVIAVIAASSKGDSQATRNGDESQTPVSARNLNGSPKPEREQAARVDDRQGNLADVIQQHNATKPDRGRATPTSPIGTFNGKENAAQWSFGTSGLSDPRVAISGLVLWLDAAEGSTVLGGKPLNKWTDKSGNGNHAIPPRNADPPLHKDRLINGHAAMQFDGGKILSVKNAVTLNLGANYTILFVAAGRGPLLFKGQPQQGNVIALQPDISHVRFSKQSSHAAEGDNPNDLKVRVILADQKSVTWFVGGKPAGEYDGAHEINNGSAIQIGGLASRGNPRGGFNGTLAELLIYNRALPDTERQNLEAYLQEKWLK